jgi:hypothetical protein
MENKGTPPNEGHTREWQDRARVVLDAKEAAKTEASPMQSPPDNEKEDVEEKSKNLNPDEEQGRVY